MSEEVKTKICPFCNEETNANSDKCDVCGEKFLKKCPFCGEEINIKAKKCKHCGEFLDGNTHQNINDSITEFPEELKKFNWGAFWGSWIWGICNNVKITLWYIPVFILVFIITGGNILADSIVCMLTTIYIGIKGNELAWKNKKWDNIAHFNRVQKNWAIWCSILGILGLLYNLGITLS